jgi:hypothetical protein
MGCKPGYQVFLGKPAFPSPFPIQNRQGKNGDFPIFSVPQPVLKKIRLPINAICFLNFTPEEKGKMLNYARFFGNYARKPGPVYGSWNAG